MPQPTQALQEATPHLGVQVATLPQQGAQDFLQLGVTPHLPPAEDIPQHLGVTPLLEGSPLLLGAQDSQSQEGSLLSRAMEVPHWVDTASLLPRDTPLLLVIQARLRPLATLELVHQRQDKAILLQDRVTPHQDRGTHSSHPLRLLVVTHSNLPPPSNLLQLNLQRRRIR